MNTRRTFLGIFLAALIALFLVPATLFAADAKKEELQKRFKERYPEIRKLKDAGVVGETDTGEIAFVSEKDSNAAKLVEEENADRHALYELIAKDEGTSVETVAKHAAQRNFEKAKQGDFLKTGGKWKKKA
jgi:uncharacterized protein YdbL (DUF1318 family)